MDKLKMHREEWILGFIHGFLTMEAQNSHTLAHFRNEILTTVSPVAETYSIVMWDTFHSGLFKGSKCFTLRPLCRTAHQRLSRPGRALPLILTELFISLGFLLNA